MSLPFAYGKQPDNLTHLIRLTFQEMKKFLQQVLNKVEGLYYVNIADKDGVTFIKGKSCELLLESVL